MKLLPSSLVLSATFTSLVFAAPTIDSRSLAARQVGPVGSNGRPTSYTVNSFDQLIDHFPNSTRYAPHTTQTFSQKYVFDDTYYVPGGPIFLCVPFLAFARRNCSSRQKVGWFQELGEC